MVVMILPLICLLFALCFGSARTYTLQHKYDYTNWYDSFTFESVGHHSVPLSILV